MYLSTATVISDLISYSWIWCHLFFGLAFGFALRGLFTNNLSILVPNPDFIPWGAREDADATSLKERFLELTVEYGKDQITEKCDQAIKQKTNLMSFAYGFWVVGII
ncbi:MAG: hypothetical protein R2883_04745 [Caldisericia bacterium]